MYTIRTEKSRLDVGMIHRYLSEESYWAKNIPRRIVEPAQAERRLGLHTESYNSVPFKISSATLK